MATMEITTNIGCKNACAYCPQGKLLEVYAKRSGVPQMSFDTFKSCLDKVPLSVDIHFTGMAEPWLNPKCTEMLLYTHQRGHKLSVSTALVGMKPSDADLLEPVPFELFTVHLPSNEHYSRIRIDENYLRILERLSKSDIKVLYHARGKSVPSRIRSLIKEGIEYGKLYTRAGNISIKDIPLPERRRGIIRCGRELRHNVLLPNGDVLLCCMDYGMKHLLGNLTASDYDSLFRGEEFLRVKKGLRDESLDILCRYCDMYAYPINRRLPALLRKLRNPYS